MGEAHWWRRRRQRRGWHVVAAGGLGGGLGGVAGGVACDRTRGAVALVCGPHGGHGGRRWCGDGGRGDGAKVVVKGRRWRRVCRLWRWLEEDGWRRPGKPSRRAHEVEPAGLAPERVENGQLGHVGRRGDRRVRLGGVPVKCRLIPDLSRAAKVHPPLHVRRVRVAARLRGEHKEVGHHEQHHRTARCRWSVLTPRRQRRCSDGRPRANGHVCVCCVCVLCKHAQRCVCERRTIESLARQARARRMGIAYTHWQPWNPGQGLSGHGCSQRAGQGPPPPRQSRCKLPSTCP